METQLINRSKVKQFALACAQDRAHKFSRVSPDFLIRIDSALRNVVRREVSNLPSVGKTIK